MSKRKGDHGYAPGWCIHYRYNRDTTDGDTCEAGVDYAELNGGSRKGMLVRLPCFIKDPDPHAAERVACEHFRAPTPEEIELHEGWAEQRLELLIAVMTGIKPWREKHKGRSHAEVVECPACKGRLHLSIAAYNGHVHGRCETEGCASWME